MKIHGISSKSIDQPKRIRLLLVGESKLDLSNIDQSKGERLLMMHSQVIKAIPMS